MSLWDRFEQVINQTAFDLFFQKNITWHRLVKKLDPHGENYENVNYTAVTLKALIDPNVTRERPLQGFSITGQLDGQYCWLILNKKYLNDNGWLTNAGHFDYNLGKDYFEIDNIRYRAHSDSNASQTDSDNVLFYILLKREEYNTGEKVFGVFED